MQVQADEKRRGEVLISWMPLHDPWMKLNFDGAIDKTRGKVSSGSIIQDLARKWVGGCIQYIGRASSLMAKLWRQRDGLFLAKDLGIKFLSVKFDALKQ